jgi:asparagine synthase (glutamine-hydrolysing)
LPHPERPGRLEFAAEATRRRRRAHLSLIKNGGAHYEKKIMCGFAGIALPHPGRPQRAVLERMASAIVHRGPDEEGFFLGEGAGLAFRRLRIIDLTTGAQPMANEDGSVIVVFNGEIYNYRELRAELTLRGHRFATSSDTEVLVHLYEECEERLLDRLNGMFAFAIWDTKKRSLLLARDPVGIKPLLYADTGSGFLFGSEMGAILAAGHVDDSIDPWGLHLLLSWGAVPAPRTILRSVRRLPPGHFLLWKDGHDRVQRYWHPLDDAPSCAHTLEEGGRALRHLLDDAVRRQTISDVPLGAFLSGGIDSTSLVGLVRRHVDETHTFSVGFAGEPIFDETRYARAAAAFHDTNHVEAQLQSRDVQALVPEILDGLAEPFASASLLPAFAVSRMTRRQMTVALSGDGADELFGGYNKYLGENMLRWLRRIPAPIRRATLESAAGILPVSRANRAGELSRKARRLLEGIDSDAARRHDRWMRFASAEDISKLIGASSPANGEEGNPGLAIIRQTHADYDARGLSDPLNRVLFTDFSVALPTDMLLKVDHASMRNSLEVRVPFLDPRIVRAAFAMPGHWKIRGRRQKIVLKEAVQDLLPPEIRRRPKAGFDVPVGEWIKSSMRDLFHDVALSPGRIPLERKVIEKWYAEHASNRADRSKALWAVFALKWWEQAHARRRTAARAESMAAEPVEILS